MAGRQGVGLADWMERRWVVVAVYLTLSAVVLYPILSVSVPPLIDYPNHLARMYILSHWDTDAALQRNYVTDWKLLPNMAMEIFVPALARFMPIYVAGKIFIVAAFLSILGGTLALRKVLVGKIGLWPVLTFLLLYNHILLWGFLNYIFTAGLALLAFAGWIALRERQRPFRVLLFSIVAVGLYIGHLFGLFVYGLLVFGYEIWRTRNTPAPVGRHLREWAETGIQFVVPAVLFLLWVADNRSTDGTLTDFGGMADRMAVFVAPTHFDMMYIDVPVLIFLASLWPLCRSQEGVSFTPSLIIPLIVATVVALLMPRYLSGVWGTHLRLPIIICCLLIAGTRLSPRTCRPLPYILGVAIALIVIRTASIAEQWRDIDGKYTEFRQAVATIEPGARLLPIGDLDNQPDDRSYLYRMRFSHIASLAVIERSVFLPTLFTGFTTIDAAPGLRYINSPFGSPVSPELLTKDADAATSGYALGHRFERYVTAFWPGWPTTFDYAVSLRFSRTDNPSPGHLKSVVDGSYFDIYRVVKPAIP